MFSVRAVMQMGFGLAVFGWGRLTADDPCTLLSASEAAPYVGPLASPPYLASDGVPDVHGDQCVYRGTDGRVVTVQATWSGGAAAGKVTQDVPDKLGSGLAGAGATGMDTMAHRVMKAEAAGPWDRATWIPGGALLATKGDASVDVDVTGTSGKEADALALARIMVPRLAHPLAYDGAKAVALAPKPVVHPARACDFIPVSQVVAAIGPLDGAPAPDTPDSPETTCTYRVHTAAGERIYAVSYGWQNGQKAYAAQTHGMATMGALMGTPTSSPLDTMHQPPAMKTMMGAMMKMIGGSSDSRGAATAPGATATVGMRTDTALVGPWDRAALLHGTQLMAVRRDVIVAMSLQSADYDRAKALLAAICLRM
ncbi:MAG: hypothetical protein ACRENQ_02630 [Gemmatimonadaceae bacterium]